MKVLLFCGIMVVSREGVVMAQLPGETFYEYQARMKREGLYNGGNGFVKSNPKSVGGYINNVSAAYKDIWSKRTLPTSPIAEKYRDRVMPRGFYDLVASEITTLPSEDHIHGIKRENYHEKSWPMRLGIINADHKVVPHYFRTFDAAEGGLVELSSKLITNAVFGRLFPTKMENHIARMNSFGTLGIDVNNIDGVKSIRLDKYLYQKGIPFNGIRDLLNGVKSGAFSEDLTDYAIVQLALGGFTIPNAIGEQDPNTRNIILLGPDKKGAKYDSVVRIDFENSRTGQKQANIADPIRVYPFGMFGRDEDKIEFKENILKAVKDKILTKDDVAFLLDLNTLTGYATRNSAIDNATMDAISDTKYIDKNGHLQYPSSGLFTPDKFYEVVQDVAKSSKNYTDDVSMYLKGDDSGHSFFNNPVKDVPNLEK